MNNATQTAPAAATECDHPQAAADEAGKCHAYGCDLLNAAHLSAVEVAPHLDRKRMALMSPQAAINYKMDAYDAATKRRQDADPA